jgi:predicted NAD/FAD-binding protein
VSGLVAAYFLHPEHDVTLFEADERPGGHVNTVALVSGSRSFDVDTGFVVFNEPAYPRFTRLLAELGVETQPTSMSFSVRSDRDRIEYNGGSLRGLFSDPRTACRPAFLRMLGEIPRFNRMAATVAATSSESLGDFLAGAGFSRALRDWYVLPMIAAIWSAPLGNAAEFPVGPLMAFCRNHGLLSVAGRPVWRTIRGGAFRYVDRITAALGDRVRVRRRVTSVARARDGVLVKTADGSSARFDEVVIAVHGDEVLGLLESPTPQERAAFGAFRYVENEVVLHTDESMLPSRAHARASWYAVLPEHPGEPVCVTYDMNRLQRLGAPGAVCISLNATDRIAPHTIAKRFRYRHPLLRSDLLDVQRRVEALNGERGVHYCGAYLGYGFHEDGVVSAMAVARRIAGRDERALSAA